MKHSGEYKTLFYVERGRDGLWYVHDKNGDRVPKCGRWDDHDKAFREGAKYFGVGR